MKLNLINLVLLSFTLVVINTSAPAYADNAAVMTKQAQEVMTPAQALDLLKQGNQRFASGNMKPRDYLAQVKQTVGGQFPFASIVSCLDSRIPPAIVFDQGMGDLFVARVAGNFVNDDILGSLEFATKLSGSKVIVVMGHTDCGAIKGACDGAQLGLLTSTLANINPAVTAVGSGFTPLDSTNVKYVQAVADMNVKLTMQKIRDRSLVLRGMIDRGDIILVGAMYDLATGKVSFYD